MSVSRSVMSDSLRPHGLWTAGILCPWDFPGKNTGVSSHFLLQEIFLTQESTLGLTSGRFFTIWATSKGVSEVVSFKLRPKVNPSGREWGKGALGTEVRRLARAGESSVLGVISVRMRPGNEGQGPDGEAKGRTMDLW